ncbi:MAG: hypothetical protein JO172_07290 [Hyphomicrobiales bacterium]|nr:hypothetical protein [Hyphomicrobiales bacterium]
MSPRSALRKLGKPGAEAAAVDTCAGVAGSVTRPAGVLRERDVAGADGGCTVAEVWACDRMNS